MRVLITGGAGFLGLHMARRLLMEGYEVVLLDIADFDTSEYEILGEPLPEGWESRVEFYKGDVRNPQAVDNSLVNVDVAIHAAAALPLWHPKDIITTNVEGTKVVLERSKKQGIERVIFISSTAVYGIPEKHPLYEDDPLDGVGPYGKSKIVAEQICLQFRQQGMVVPIVRPKTFIGPGRLGVFQILFDWVERGKPIPVIGTGLNRYQLLDVQDLTEALMLLLTLPSDLVNDTFNIGAERFGTVYEDVQALCDHAGTGAFVFPTPSGLVKPTLRLLEVLKLSPLYKWVYGTADKDSFVAIDRAKEKLGWQPKYSNAESLCRTYDWYLAHKDEIQGRTGVTHRVAWGQGALKIVRDLLPSGKKANAKIPSAP
ncbi:MAG: NAD-dependent epimerase/dehydratase family protein [Candidatus Fervidibacter sp.]|uniref:NAD-dependent epimerase/dehydratase family protein n=1 Tax=Candidatus Fervidibacter sp. TaxID=3100871 RepID=UPI00404920CF